MAKGSGDFLGLNPPGDINKVADATKEATKAEEGFSDALAKGNQQLEDRAEYTKNVSLDEEKQANAVKAATAAIKEKVLALANELNLYNQLKSAAGGYLDSLKKVTLLSAHYARMLKEVDDAQKAYIGSVNFSSKSVDNASKTLQNHIRVINRMKVESLDLAKKYKTDIKDFDEISTTVWDRFNAQIMASRNSLKLMKSATESVFLVAKTAGISAADAVNFMAVRGESSTKTFGGLNKEMKSLAVVVDNYKDSLKSLGRDAMERMLLTSKQLVATLADISSKFDHGTINVKVYGNILSGFAVGLQKLGLNSKMTQRNLGALNQLFIDMNKADLQDFFGTMAGMEVAETGGIGMLITEDAKKKVKAAMDLAASEGITDMVARSRMAGEAAASDIGYQRKQAQLLIEKMPTRVLMEQLIGKGATATGAAESIAHLRKLAKMSDEELKEAEKTGSKDLEAFKNIQDAVQKGSTPEEKSYQAVVKIREVTQSIERLLKQSLAAGIIAGVAGTAVSAGAAVLQGRLIASGVRGALTGAKTAAATGRVAEVFGGTAKAAPRLAGAASGLARAGAAAKIAGGIATGGLSLVAGEVIIGMIKDKGKEIWDGVKSLVSGIGSVVTPIIKGVIKGFELLVSPLRLVGKILGTVLAPLLKLFGALFGKLGEGLKELGGWINKGLKPVFSAMATVGKIVTDTFDDMMEPVNWLVRKLTGASEEARQTEMQQVREELEKIADPEARKKEIETRLKSDNLRELYGKKGIAELEFMIKRDEINAIKNEDERKRAVEDLLKNNDELEKYGEEGKKKLETMLSDMEKRKKGEKTSEEEKSAAEKERTAFLERSGLAEGKIDPAMAKYYATVADKLMGAERAEKLGAPTDAATVAAWSKVKAEDLAKTTSTLEPLTEFEEYAEKKRKAEAEKAPKLKLDVGGMAGIVDAKFDEAAGTITFPNNIVVSASSFQPIVAKGIADSTSRGAI